MEYIFDENGNELLPEPKTVAQVNEYVKCLIEEEMLLQDIYVCGEVSNFKKHSSGHFYFTLKDSSSEIRAVMFRSYAQKVKFNIENGLKVIVRARVGVFESAGMYQLYVNTMQPEGMGALHLAFEQLKSKLLKEGLFDEAHKRPIPKFPKRIGIITSPTGAAVRDIINIATRRYNLASLILFPSLVQGEEAAGQLISGIDYFNITESVDVIIIGRGGGSIEDLWAFNDEYLARAIYNSKIPVISAVGHEIDFTICDFVADLRAPTPSAAAELATPNLADIVAKIDGFKSRSILAISSLIEEYKTRLEYISSSKVFKSPISMLEIPKLRLSAAKKELISTFTRAVMTKRNDFSQKVAKINALNPLSILSRGFATVISDEGKTIKSINDIEKNSKISIRFLDGSAQATIDSKERIE
ncbi:MAG: exodeoxyribonuclease VII large subunit [Clostridia bacterium]|nr:exodeoxyribonuclease VII large subunit [Clostridia bacterium]